MARYEKLNDRAADDFYLFSLLNTLRTGTNRECIYIEQLMAEGRRVAIDQAG